MRNLITNQELYVEAQMIRHVGSYTVLLVEGDSDSRTLSSHLSKWHTHTIVGNGKSAVLKAAQQASENGSDRIIALVDSDLDADPEEAPANELVVTTEHYDLEADLFLLPRMALRLISAFVDDYLLEAIFPQPALESAVQYILNAAGLVGILRLWSARNSLGLHLRELPFEQILTATNGINKDKAAAIIRGKSKAATSIDEIKKLISAAEENYADETRWCCGHDLASALSAAITLWRNKKSIPRDHIENTLRAAVSDNDIVKLKIYREINRIASNWGGIVWRVDAEDGASS